MPIKIGLDELGGPVAAAPQRAAAPCCGPRVTVPARRVAYVVSGKNGVVLRAASSLESAPVGELRCGTRVSVDSTVSVTKDGRVVERALLASPLVGWCSMRLLTADAAEEEQAIEEYGGGEDEDLRRALALSLGEADPGASPMSSGSRFDGPGRSSSVPGRGESAVSAVSAAFQEPAAPRFSVPARGPTRLFVGAKVEVSGTADASYEGLSGVVVAREPSDDRWGVDVQGKGVKALKEAHLTLVPQQGLASWVDAALDAVGPQTEVCCLGESTHGSADYYAIRIALTKSLVTLYGFSVVAVEGDWISAERVDRYVHGAGQGSKRVLKSHL